MKNGRRDSDVTLPASVGAHGKPELRTPRLLGSGAAVGKFATALPDLDADVPIGKLLLLQSL